MNRASTRRRRERAIVDELRRHPTFATCSQAGMTDLVTSAGPFRLPAQWSVLQQGIPADALYIILTGTAHVFDERRHIATLGPGDLFGEMAYLSASQRRATVTSATEMTGIRIDYDTLTELLQRQPRLSDLIADIHAERLETSASR